MMTQQVWRSNNLRSKWILFLFLLSDTTVTAKRNPRPFLFTLFERPARKLANQLNPLTPPTESIRRRQSIAFAPTPFDDVQDGGTSSSYYLPGPKLWKGNIREPMTDAAFCGMTYDCSYDLSSSRGIQWELELLDNHDKSRQFQCILFDGRSEWTCDFTVPSSTTTIIELPFVDFTTSTIGETMRTESIQRIRLLHGRRSTKKRRNPTFRAGELRLTIHSLRTY